MNRFRNQRGYLLLEVMLAVALVAIGLFVLVESLDRCLAAARAIQAYSIAQTLLSNKSYEFRVERPLDTDDHDGEFEDYPNYKWSRHIETTNTDDLWLQTITVSWKERGKIATESVSEYRYLPEKKEQ